MNTAFIVTSCIKNLPGRGVFSHQERFEQTLETFKSIKSLSPNSKIILADDSIEELPEEWMNQLNSFADIVITFGNHQQIQHLSKNGFQSLAECLLMIEIFRYIQMNNTELKFDRIFKITGRCCLDEGFDISHYENLDGCFVYKKRVQSWMGQELQLLDTRMWSISSSLLLETIGMYHMMIDFINRGFDLEHATFACIPKEKLVEFDRVYLKGRVASDGTWRFD
jgi:hypothetical protein